MPNVSSGAGNTFLNSFMLGFGVVDQANSNKRRDRMLKERLAQEQEDRLFKREVINEQRANARDDRTFALSERERLTGLREAGDRARNLMSDPNASIEELEALDEDVGGAIPFLTDEIRRRRTDETQFSDFNNLFEGIGGDQVTGQPGDQDLVDQDPNFSGQVEAAALPGTQGPAEPVGPAELRAMSLRDPVEAAAIRDEQNAVLVEQQFTEPDERGNRLSLGRGPTEAGKRKIARQEQQNETQTYWSDFNNAENPSGDAARQLSPEIATAKYFDDRSTLTPEQQAMADEGMQPRINATIKSQNAILATAPHASIDARNAQRKLKEANRLAHTIGIEYNPGSVANVNSRGMPVGNNAVSEAAGAAMTSGSPGVPGGFSQAESRAASAVVKAIKPGTTRFNDAQMRSIYRLYRDGKLTTNDVDSLRRTGQLPRPPGEYQTLNTGDGSQALYYLDGVGGAQLVAEGGKNANGNRITLTDDGLKEASKAFEQFGDNAISYRNEFVASLFDARDQIQARGFDLERPEDVSRLSQLYAQGVIVREDYNSEWYEDGEFNPDYTSNYGTIWESILNPIKRGGVQRYVTKENSGIFGDDLELGDVPPSQARGADVDYARQVLAEQGHPAANSATPQEAVQLVVEMLTQQQGQ